MRSLNVVGLIKRASWLSVAGVLALWASLGYSDGHEATPAIGGYSPVSYFTKQRAEKGSAQFAVEHEGRTYWLASQEQADLFLANPEKYRPRYDVCPYSLTLGKRLPLDPKNFKIVGGSLLLFHSSEQDDGLKSFERSGLSEEELIRRADANYVLFKFN